VEPHVFDWLLADRLGVCVNPSVSVTAATELKVRDIGLLVNLHEMPDPSDLLSRLSATSVHLPVQNSDPPSQAQLDAGVAAIREAIERGTRVAVHCGAGLGRSGTLLAAYLVSDGETPDVAIARVRAARPGAIETLEQERAVHVFASRQLGVDVGRERGAAG
jgi:atypical dual specificity phosphatase